MDTGGGVPVQILCKSGYGCCTRSSIACVGEVVARYCADGGLVKWYISHYQVGRRNSSICGASSGRGIRRWHAFRKSNISGQCR